MQEQLIGLQRDKVDLKCLVAAKEVSIKICKAPLEQQIADLRDCLNTREEYMEKQLQKLGMTKRESQFQAGMILGDLAKLKEAGCLKRKPAPKKGQKPAFHWAETRAVEPKYKANQTDPKANPQCMIETIKGLYTPRVDA